MITDKDNTNLEWELLQKKSPDSEVFETIRVCSDTHTYLNTYVANNLSELSQTDENGEYIAPERTVNGGGKGKYNVEYQILISADESLPDWQKSLTPFDVAMLYCACSLWINGVDVIYSDLLYSQWTDGNRLRKDGGTRAQIDESLEKMSSISLKYDYAAEFRRKHSTFTGSIEVDGHILELSPATITVGGHEVKAFRVLTEPPILTHAKAVNQIITVKRELLTIQEVSHKDGKKKLLSSEVQLTPDRALVRDYLIRRIYEYKNYLKKFKTIATGKRKAGNNDSLPQPKHFNKIVLDTMFKELKIFNPTTKTRLKQFVLDCMDYWEMKKLIKGYKTEKSNGLKAIIFDI